MTSLLDGFNKNTNIFRGDLNKIDQQAFEALVEEHGLSVAIGYMKCLVEFTEAISKALLVETSSGFHVPQTKANAYGRMSNLHHAVFNFIKQNGIDADKMIKPYPFITKSKGWQ